MKADEKFDSVDFSKYSLDGEYDNCIFESCNFSNLDLSEISFIECRFVECNFTLAKLTKTGFKDVRFDSCKMLGLQFTDLKPFLLEMDFKNCHLEESSFYKLDLKGLSMNSCNLRGADFSEANLEKSSIIACDLSECTFERTNLSFANLSDSYNFQIDPEQNTIRGATFNADQLCGLLTKYNLQIKN